MKKTKQSARASGESSADRDRNPTPLQLLEAAKLLNLDLMTRDPSFDDKQKGITLAEYLAEENERAAYLREKLTVAMGVWKIAQEVIDRGASEYHSKLEDEERWNRSRAFIGGPTIDLKAALAKLRMKTRGGLEKAIKAVGIDPSVLSLDKNGCHVELIAMVERDREKQKRMRDRKAAAEARKKKKKHEQANS